MSALDRLAREYPDQFKAEASRSKPLYEVSDRKSVLNHFENATDNPMGRAIMLAVLLDQHSSGDVEVADAVHHRAAAAFEEALKEMRFIPQ